MTYKDSFLVEANMLSYNGKHWFDPEKKARFMLYRGVTFIWHPYREIWLYYEEEQ